MLQYDHNEVLSAADFDTVSNVLGLTVGRKTSKNVPFLCPAHNDKRIGNCNWSREKKVWHCFSCHASGNLATLVAYKLYGSPGGKNYSNAIKWLAELYHISGKDVKVREIPFISSEDQEFIGVYNNSIYAEDGTCIMASPLYNLYQNDKEAYNTLIKNKTMEKEQELTLYKNDYESRMKRCLEKSDLPGYIFINTILYPVVAEDLERLMKIKTKYKIY